MLEPTQRLVMAAYLRLLGATGPGELVDYRFDDAVVKVLEVSFPYDDGGVVTFCGSIGIDRARATPHYFVSVVEAEVADVAALVASSHHFDAVIAKLGDGDTFPLGAKSPLGKRGFVAALVVDAQVYGPFADATDIEEKLGCHFLATIPIDAKDFEIKKTRGVDELFDTWRKQRRSIIQWYVAP